MNPYKDSFNYWIVEQANIKKTKAHIPYLLHSEKKKWKMVIQSGGGGTEPIKTTPKIGLLPIFYFLYESSWNDDLPGRAIESVVGGVVHHIGGPGPWPADSCSSIMHFQHLRGLWPSQFRGLWAFFMHTVSLFRLLITSGFCRRTL